MDTFKVKILWHYLFISLNIIFSEVLKSRLLAKISDKKDPQTNPQKYNT